MFNKDNDKKINSVSEFTGSKSDFIFEDDSENDKKKIIIFSLALLFFLVVLGAAFYFYNRITNNNQTPAEVLKPADEASGFLPGDNLDNNKNGDNSDSDADGLQGEKITLGQFYKEPKIDFEPKVDRVEMPLNVKSDVVNFYDISRKINLDNVVSELDNNGFSVINNPFSKSSSNFYDIYSLLNEKNIPFLVTDDYILYYFQNNLKQIYKRIEKDVFYYSIRETSNKLFEIASARYKKNIENTGVTNDPAIEGQRMYLAYLGVILKLLSPTPEQINDKVSLGEYYFTSPEGQKFGFDLPSYLNDDVLKEVELIRKASKIEKSPIFKYQIDYSAFKVPDEYSEKAKLNNFYLASQWIRSVFPLYYKTETCPNCLVDKDDWIIGMAAACFMTKDLSDNQNIKNEWAKIYKIISFFSGLRQELIYLDYQSALVDSFGKDYKLEKLFARQNPDMMANALKLKEELEKLNFDKTRGGYGRESEEEMKLSGLRLLQDIYLPDNYIYSNLTHPNVGNYLGDYKDPQKTKLTTNCRSGSQFYRCLSSGYDLVDIFYSIPNDNKFYVDNSNYDNYQNQISKVREDIKLLNVDDWHRNFFWLTLNNGNILFNQNQNNVNSFFENILWKERITNTMLGSLLNKNLSFDKYQLAENKAASLTTYREKNKYNYVEPNIYLINELQASTVMLNDYLFHLKIMDEAALLKGDLERLNKNIGILKQLIEKELKNEDLNDGDQQMLSNFLFEYNLVELGERERTLVSPNKSLKQIQSINDVKLLIVINKVGPNYIFRVGPVFNYKEY